MNNFDDLIKYYLPDIFSHSSERLRALCHAVSDRVAAKIEASHRLSPEQQDQDNSVGKFGDF